MSQGRARDEDNVWTTKIVERRMFLGFKDGRGTMRYLHEELTYDLHLALSMPTLIVAFKFSSTTRIGSLNLDLLLSVGSN